MDTPYGRVDHAALTRVLRQQIATHTCAHCWHHPRVWQGPLPAPRHCCWCGVQEQPQHGPYAEEEPYAAR